MPARSSQVRHATSAKTSRSPLRRLLPWLPLPRVRRSAVKCPGCGVGVMSPLPRPCPKCGQRVQPSRKVAVAAYRARPGY